MTGNMCMNKQVTIIVDSTADLLPRIRSQVEVVPLTVCFGGQEYVDGVTITKGEFYEKLVESDTLPTTSQATPAAFEEMFAKVCGQGGTAVVLTLSAHLSGTYQSAVIAAEEYPGVFVVDTESAAIGAGILVELALRLVNQGLTAQQIAQALEQEKKNIRVVAMLDTLEYLKRGGRISKTVALAGSLLNIKPVVALQNGAIQVLGKARGSRQANNLLVQEIEKAGGVDFTKPVLLGYTGLSDALLQKYREDSRSLWEESREALEQTQIGSVIGTHAGPGAVAVAFFRK